MASKKFHRKIREIADQVMDDGEVYRAGIAGQAGQGVASKVGGQSGAAQLARAGATVTGKAFNALAILTDRNVYLIQTPMLKAYEVKEVVLKAALAGAEVDRDGVTRIRIADYHLTHTFKMSSEAREFLELAAEGRDSSRADDSSGPG